MRYKNLIRAIALLITLLFCVNVHGRTLNDGINTGLYWCLTPTQKCSVSVIYKALKRYLKHYLYFQQHSGGILPYHMAMTSVTECPSGSPCACSKDKVLKECGIMGIKWETAEACNVDVRNNEASVWCASTMANLRRISFTEKYPQAKQLPLHELYMISGLNGGIGPSASKIIELSGALKVNKNGKLIHASPHKRLISYARSIDERKKIVEFILTNRRFDKYTLGIRIARIAAVMKILLKMYGKDKIEDLPFKEFSLPKRPDNLPPYPGYKEHGKCPKYFR